MCERMTVSDRPIDPFLVDGTEEIVGRRLDRQRAVALAELVEDALTAAICGLANGLGGHVLLGAATGPDGETVRSTPGVDASAADHILQRLAARADPPVADLLATRRLATPAGRELVLVSVGRSPRPPHLDGETGLIWLHGPEGLGQVRSRSSLDLLYAQGRAERDRAERLIEAMTERLMLAHFGYYGLGLIACLQRPSAEVFLWAQEHLAELACEGDPFMAEWGFTPEMAKVRPAEIELRNEREVCGLVRVARSGCLAIGEIRRRPPQDLLGSPEELGARVRVLIDSACRILSTAESPLIVPLLFCEGLKGTRLRLDGEAGQHSRASTIDAVQLPGPTGDAGDPQYRERLAALFLDELCRPFLGAGGSRD
jgi:hypothetical protein